MPKRLLPWLIIVAASLAACTTEQPNGPRLAHGFQEVSVNALISNQLIKDLPIRIKLPAIYKPHKPTLSVATIWSVEEDWKKLSKHKDAVTTEGFIIATISPTFGYDQTRDLFFGTPSGDETTMVSDLIKEGWVDVHVTRENANGYPVLVVEGGRADGKRLRMLYIGIRTGVTAIFIHYHCRQPWSDIDDLVWKTLKDSVLTPKK